MATIKADLRGFVKHLIGVYFGMPDPRVGGLLIADYAKKFQDSRLAQRIKPYNRADRTVA